MKQHKPIVEIVGTQEVPGIDRPVTLYGKECLICGRPVRRIFHRPDVTFWHAAGKPKEGDPRRESPRRESWSRAISAGLKEANERRKAARR